MGLVDTSIIVLKAWSREIWWSPARTGGARTVLIAGMTGQRNSRKNGNWSRSSTVTRHWQTHGLSPWHIHHLQKDEEERWRGGWTQKMETMTEFFLIPCENNKTFCLLLKTTRTFPWQPQTFYEWQGPAVALNLPFSECLWVTILYFLNFSQ